MATKTIGTGGNYTSLALYLAYLQTLGTLAAPEVGEIKNEELSISAQVDFSGFTPTATNTWTLKCETGASFRDNANKATNGLRYNAGNGAAIDASAAYTSGIKISVPYAIFRDIQLRNTAVSASSKALEVTGDNCSVDFCILESRGAGNVFSTVVTINDTSSTSRIRNCLLVPNSASEIYGYSTPSGGPVHFCTVVIPSDLTPHASSAAFINSNYVTTTIQNCVAAHFSAFKAGSGTLTGSGNATDLGSLPTGLTGQVSLIMTTEFEQPSNAGSAMDWRLKSSSVKCQDNGTSDATNGANDIIGTSRPLGAAYDIGCWEFAAGGGGPAAVANPFALLGVGRAA